jgi:hypothetical protein
MRARLIVETTPLGFDLDEVGPVVSVLRLETVDTVDMWLCQLASGRRIYALPSNICFEYENLSEKIGALVSEEPPTVLAGETKKPERERLSFFAKIIEEAILMTYVRNGPILSPMRL